MPIPKRDSEGKVRIPILYKMNDEGVMIYGKVESGTINIGEKITIAPSLYPCQILYIFNAKDELVKYAKAGENVILKLEGIEDEELISVGNVICNRNSIASISELFIAEIKIL